MSRFSFFSGSDEGELKSKFQSLMQTAMTTAKEVSRLIDFAYSNQSPPQEEGVGDHPRFKTHYHIQEQDYQACVDVHNRFLEEYSKFDSLLVDCLYLNYDRDRLKEMLGQERHELESLRKDLQGRMYGNGYFIYGLKLNYEAPDPKSRAHYVSNMEADDTKRLMFGFS